MKKLINQLLINTLLMMILAWIMMLAGLNALIAEATANELLPNLNKLKREYEQRQEDKRRVFVLLAKSECEKQHRKLGAQADKQGLVYLYRPDYCQFNTKIIIKPLINQLETPIFNPIPTQKRAFYVHHRSNIISTAEKNYRDQIFRLYQQGQGDCERDLLKLKQSLKNGGTGLFVDPAINCKKLFKYNTLRRWGYPVTQTGGGL